MDVFAPADQPLVVFAGGTEDESTLRTALSRLLGAVALLAAGSVLVQYLVADLPFLGEGSEPAAGGDGGGPSIAVNGGGTATPQATPEPVQAAADGAASLPPGILFFAGGLFVLAVVVTVWYVR
jgi:hypothetical protein